MSSMNTNLVTQVELARALAKKHHAGQTDKQGRDYFTYHLEPIARLLEPYGPAAVAVGLLHDIIEDCGLTEQDLLNAGVEPVIARSVVLMSRVPGEPYSDLIERSASTRLSALGKLADNTWNIMCNSYLAKTDPKKAGSLLRRYEKARPVLVAGAELERGDLSEMEHEAHWLAEKLQK